jgi:BirA family biotin operon repressor/biotin-[acetyl-CoA-carboxylase] ligase
MLDLDAVKSRLGSGRFGGHITYLASCDSTMNVARREAESGASEGAVVIAEEQTAGRGRFGRSWVSPAGKNLYLTLIAKPPIDRLRTLSMAAPLAVCEAAEDVTGFSPQIKWPNDVLIAGRKMSGILVESELSADTVRFALVGVGINVNLDVEASPEIAQLATSLLREAGKEVSREDLLVSFLTRFGELYELPLPQLVDRWRDGLETLGREVAVTMAGETHRGVAERVDDEGNLLLRLPDGAMMTFEAGEVSLRAPTPR